MIKARFRKNSGTRKAGAVTTYKKEVQKVQRVQRVQKIATYEDSIEHMISEREAINDTINNL